MKIIILSLLILIGIHSFANADYQKGKAALSKKDYETAAIEWSNKDSDESPNSIYQLGLLYFKGRGVPEDKDKAYEFFMEAAVMGLSSAQNTLWNINKGKAQTKEEKAQAVEWLIKAAQQGNPKAQYSLGRAYAGVGEFLRKDNIKAYIWLERAVMNGNGQAEKDLRVIKRRLSPKKKAKKATPTNSE